VSGEEKKERNNRWRWLSPGLLRRCSLVEVHRRFRGACCLHHRNISESSLNFYWTARRNNPEDSHLHTRRHENLTSHDIMDDCTLDCTKQETSERGRLSFPHLFMHCKTTVYNIIGVWRRQKVSLILWPKITKFWSEAILISAFFTVQRISWPCSACN
jgi:hypothetical protein